MKKTKSEIKKDVTDKLKDIDVGKQKDINVFIGNKRQPLPPNIMVFQTFAYLAATILKPNSNKVLMLFFAESAYENYIGIDQQTIADKIGISLRSVNHAVNELEKEGIIIKTPHPSDRRRIDYFLNPFSSWKGNSFTRSKILNSLPDNQLKLFDIEYEDSQAREVREVINKSPELKKEASKDYKKSIEEHRDTSFE